MKLLLFVLVAIGTVGCASSQERIIELSAEAKECVKQSTNELGVTPYRLFLLLSNFL